MVEVRFEGGMGIKYPKIKECFFKSYPPEPACCYVEPSIILCAGGAEVESFTSELLEVRVNGNVVAHFCEEIGH